MSAPEIPNLLQSLRGSRPTRGNARSRRSKPEHLGSSPDHVIQQTDDDAAGSRLSAVKAGYLRDGFAQMLAGAGLSARRMPIINRGTYVRTIAIDTLVNDFLRVHAPGKAQIISLGAGTDTRFFRLMEQQPQLASRLRYHEIDFAACTAKKIRSIERENTLMRLLQQSAQLARDADLPYLQESSTISPTTADGVVYTVHISPDKTNLHSPAYSLVALDLRDLVNAGTDVGASDQQTNFKAHQPFLEVSDALPTLLLSECCLTYLAADSSSSVINQILQHTLAPTTAVSMIQYEPLEPFDAFGKTMTANLGARGISLPGLTSFPTLQSHGERLRACGFEASDGVTVKQWWDRKVGEAEKDRLRLVEGLDEEEEWHLLAAHYGLIWAWKGRKSWQDMS